IEDAMRVVDQHARNAQLLQRLAMLAGIVAPRIAGRSDRIVQLGKTRSDRQAGQRRQDASACHRLENAAITVDDPEQALRIDRLRRSEKEVATRPQGIMEGAADLALQSAVEIDEQIAAGDEVDMREWRV